MIEAWQYLTAHPDKVLGWTVGHIWITLVACGIVVVLGISVGIYITGKGRERTADIFLYVAEIMMTVPSMALFGLLMLVLGSMGLKAIGFLPAVVALIVYGQLPILRNTYIAIQQVDPAIVEAGKGMGMTEIQILLRIKLPLAAPVIMAGLRNSIVLIIGIATIAAFIGAGGLGVPIFRGIRNARMDLILIGGIGVSILALLVDISMARLEHLITPRGLKRG